MTFGYFALPFAAVVALGLLFAGIKVFFLTPPDRGAPEIARIERPVFSEQPPAAADEPDLTLAGRDSETIAPEKSAAADTPMVLAAPIAQPGKPARAPSVSSVRAADAKNTQKRVSPEKTSRPTPAAASAAKSKWGVQVGAFVSEDSASTLVSEIKKQGYSVSVSKTDSSGKTFHRVRVDAGNSKEDADRLAAELRQKGYPVSVIPMP
jgi:cell division septation protein DedD